MITAIPGLISSLAASAGIGAPPSPASAPSPGTGAPGFGQTLAQVSNDAIKTLQGSEQMSVAGIEGKASVQQVVQSVMSANLTLQTALAIRDKAVAAYQDLSRMAI